MQRKKAIIKFILRIGLGMAILFFPLFFAVPSCNMRVLKTKQPNIIIIMVDALRPDYLGCYGFEGDISPNIDAFASQSIVFTRAYSAASWTRPSIASLFTSLDPQTHGLFRWVKESEQKSTKGIKIMTLPDEAVTLAELLKEGGYTTVCISGHEWLDPSLGYSQGFDHCIPHYASRHGTHLTGTAIVEDGLRWLEQLRFKKPFFVYFHIMDVHGPYQCEEEDFLTLSRSPTLSPKRLLTKAEEDKLIGHYLNDTFSGQKTKLRKDLRNWKNCYAAGIRRVDRIMGPLFEKMESLGLFNDSIVMLTADHGEAFLEHGYWEHHTSLYNVQLRVPFIVHVPRNFMRGFRNDQLISLMDVYPTLAYQADAKGVPSYVQGMNISKLFQGCTIRKKRYVIASGMPHQHGAIAVQSEKFKLIWDYPDGKAELFDLKNDPGEQNNLIGVNLKEEKRLKKVVRNHVEKAKKIKFSSHQPARLTDENIEGLKALGYLQ